LQHTDRRACGAGCSSRLNWSLPFRKVPFSRLPLLPEREVEGLKKCPRLVVRLGGRADDDVHSPDLIDLVVVDLGEHDVFLDAHREIATAVEALRVQPAEVTHT